MAQSAFSDECEAITYVKALQTLEKLVTQNNDFDFFEEKYKCKPHTSVYMRIKLTMRNKNKHCNRTHEQYASVATARTNKSNYKCYTSKTHANTSHLPLISYLPLYPHLPHLPARISGQGREGRGQGCTSYTISTTLTRLFALTLLSSDRIKRASASVRGMQCSAM